MTERTPEAVVEELAARSKPEDIDKIDHQFERKLARLEQADHASAEMVDKLRAMWKMLKAPDDVVPWRSKALIMAAITYFVSPVDAILDVAGKLGYLDDAAVIRLVWDRIQRP
jgi:uncharacterized membrane protein YkvA (DUF1232 family)